MQKEEISLLVRLPKDLHKLFKLICVKEDRSMSNKVQELVAKYVAEMKYLIK